MSSLVKIYDELKFEKSASIYLPNEEKLHLPINVNHKCDITFYLSNGSKREEAKSSLEIEGLLNNKPVKAKLLSKESNANWQKYAITLEAAGPSSLELKVMPKTDGKSAQKAPDCYLAKFEIDAQPIDAQTIVDAQQSNLEERSMSVQSLGDIEHFTSFEQHGVYNFLTYIPWIYNRRFVSGAPAQQKTTALSGTYSCYFYEDLTGSTALETKNLNIPAGADKLTVGGWMHPQYSGCEMEYHILFDSKETNTGTWKFANDDIGKWVLRQRTVDIPAGSKIAYVWIRLKALGLGKISLNKLYLDDYFVDFVESISQQQTNIIVGDIGGTVYALGAETGDQIATFQTAYGYLTSTPNIVDGIAYLGDGHQNANLYALNARDLSKIWYHSIPGSIDATPEIVGEVVYTTSSTGYFYAVTRIPKPGSAVSQILILPWDGCLSFSIDREVSFCLIFVSQFT